MKLVEFLEYLYEHPASRTLAKDLAPLVVAQHPELAAQARGERVQKLAS